MPKGRRGGVFVNVLLLLVALGGVLGGIFLTLPEDDGTGPFAATPVTPLGQLKQFAGSGQLVRVQSRLVSDPKMIDGHGNALALQMVQVWRETGGSEGKKDGDVIVDYDETAPDTVWASDGTTAVAVNPANLEPYFLDPAVQSPIEDGQMPVKILELLAPIFDDVPTPQGATAGVWNIEQGASVTIFGVVTEEKGELTLQAPTDGRTFILSPLPPEEITALINAADTRKPLPGWILLGIGTVALLWLGRNLLRGRHAPPRPSRRARPEKMPATDA